MKPGDVIESDDGRRFKIGPMLAEEGGPWSKNCQSFGCRRRGCFQREDGTWEMGDCVGYHCPTCGAATSMMGHRCPERGEAA